MGVDVGVDADVKGGEGDQLYRIRDDQSNGSWLGDAGDPALPLSSDLEGFSPIGECLCVCVCVWVDRILVVALGRSFRQAQCVCLDAGGRLPFRASI